MRSVAVASIVALLLSAGAGELSAQRSGARLQTAPPPQQQTPPDQPPPARVGRPGAGRNPAEGGLNMADVNEIFRGMELTSAERILQLSEQQFAPFMNEFRHLQRVRDQHQMQRQRLLNAIRQAINGFNGQPPADDATVEALTKKFDEFERMMDQEIKARHAAVDAVLTVRQRARFRVFQENMERQKMELLAKVMRSQGRGPTPEPPIIRH